MRLSCNGCRVLRKGCSESCSIRPCLEWIKDPEAQAHATLFLAKFYGRAGLINLIGAGSSHDLRPAIFKSLLYEACGRIVNPVEGSTGLLCSGKWHLCEAAVEAVMSGSPITPLSAETTTTATPPGELITPATATSLEPSKACDIRHVSKHSSSPKDAALSVKRGRNRGVFKRSGSSRPAVAVGKKVAVAVPKMVVDRAAEIETESAGSSRDGSGVSQMRSRSSTVGGESGEDVVSGETMEEDVVVVEAAAEVQTDQLMRLAELAGVCNEELGLDLTLGYGSSNLAQAHKYGDVKEESSSDEEMDRWNNGGDLALGLGVVCQ